jgi:prepilin-type N-terminal cleavage/methylation domain-containing protein
MKPDEQNRSRGRPLVSMETRRRGSHVQPIVPICAKEMEPPIVKWGMNRQAGAFTLIELLVVIAIISILAAMILTAVSKAKNSACKATDINNLRQIVIALQAFVSDDDDVLPPPNWDNGGFASAQGTNTGWLYAVNLNASGTNKFNVKTGLFWDALQNPKIYFCPMDKPDESRASAYFGGEVIERPQQISSYAMNGAVIGYMSMIYPPVKLEQMQPEDCAFWETDETDPHNFNDGANYPGEGVSPRHYQGGIQATFGGQVNYVRLQDWYNDVAATNKNRLWCYPLSADGGDPAYPGHTQQ